MNRASSNLRRSLYSKGVFLGYKRSKANQYEHTSLIKLQGVNSRKEVDFYLGTSICSAFSGAVIAGHEAYSWLGKRLVFLYRAKKARNGTKVRTIWGRVTRPHGNSGVVRAKFAKNLPPKAMGASVRVMLYPSRV